MTEVQKKTLGLAIASLICGCFFFIPFLVSLISGSFFFIPFAGNPLGLLAIVLGIVALVKISKNKDILKGKGLAITGIVLAVMPFVIIVVFLTTITGSRLTSRDKQAKIAIAKTDITSNIPLALDLYESDNGQYPSNLQALIVNPGGLTYWNGPYIKKKPIDPWGYEYQYQYPSAHGKDYDLYSLGPDGVAGGDDIANWD